MSIAKRTGFYNLPDEIQEEILYTAGIVGRKLINKDPKRIHDFEELFALRDVDPWLLPFLNTVNLSRLFVDDWMYIATYNRVKVRLTPGSVDHGWLRLAKGGYTQVRITQPVVGGSGPTAEATGVGVKPTAEHLVGWVRRTRGWGFRC